jgi:hypothetical protein
MVINNYCAGECNPRNDDPRYKNIINHTRKMNSLTIRHIAISGEGVYGMFAGFSELTFLRLCMENNMYHPHLYHYSVGVSIGSVIITILLNARYLYEMHSTKIALNYIDAVLDMLQFDTVRSVFFDIGNGKELGDFEPLLVLQNIFIDGALCKRTQLVDFLQGNHKSLKFDNKKNYFTSREFYNWLQSNKNLENIFFVCYSLNQTKMCVFTGNRNRFLSGVNFIDYELLTYDNLIESVLCSSAIIGLYPQNNINRDRAIDGASAEVNQFVHLQILINVSYYFSSNLLFTPELQFFGITPEKNNKFTLIVNKVNMQHRYEDLLEFSDSSLPLYTTLISFLSLHKRLEFNAKTNVPLTSMFLTQPFIKEFSVNNLTKNILGPLKQKGYILQSNDETLLGANKYRRIPTRLLSKEQFEADIYGVKSYFKKYKEFKEAYYKFSNITANLMVSTHLYEANPPESIKLLDKDYKEQIGSDGKPIELILNVVMFDQFVRHTYDLSKYSLELELLTRNDMNTLNKLENIGYITGNILYDIFINQSLHTTTTDKVKCTCVKPFIGDINEIIEKGYKGFLGPNQS